MITILPVRAAAPEQTGKTPQVLRAALAQVLIKDLEQPGTILPVRAADPAQAAPGDKHLY